MTGTARSLAGAALVATLLGCAAAPPAVAPEHLARLRAEIDTAVPEGAPGMVVAVRVGDELFMQRARGMADPASGRRMTRSTAVPVGSISKPITAMAVMLLVEDGALRLDQTVGALLTEYRGPGWVATVEQLLAHTSGIPNFVDREDFETLAHRPHTVAELLALFAAEPLKFAPGTQVEYSDLGYILLGAIIERVSGMDYGEFVERRIAKPLRLRSLAFARPPAGVPGAIGQTLVDGRVVPASPIEMSVAYAAGGVVASAPDLLRLVDALVAGDLLDPRRVGRMWREVMLADGRPSGRTLGWNTCMLDGRATRAHGGHIPGFRAYLLHVLPEDLTIAVVANLDDGAPDPTYVALRAARLLLDGSPELATIALDATQRAALSGRYALPDGSVREISERDGVLLAQRGSQPPLALVALSPTHLAQAGTEGQVRFDFELGADGRASQVTTRLDCEPGETASRLATEPAR